MIRAEQALAPEIVYLRAAERDGRGRNLAGEGWLYKAALRFPEGDVHEITVGEGWRLGLNRAIVDFAQGRRRLWQELQAAVMRLAFWWAI